MIISRIGQVSIPVTDQDRALEFYTKRLGCTLAMDAPMGEGQRWIQVRLPGGESELVLYASDTDKALIGSFSNIMFNSPDLAQTYRELQAHDVEVTQPPTTEPWGSFLIFKDPDGNSFLVSGPLAS